MSKDLSERKNSKHKLNELIKKQLDPMDATPINIYEIRNYIYYGLSDESLRPKYWRVLLNYYSKNKFQIENYLYKARKNYHDVINQADLSSEDLSSKVKLIRSEIKRSAIININNIKCQDHIERILISFCIINPCIGYIQGMINLVYVFYYVLKNSEDFNDSKFCEEDAFYLFNNLVSEMSSLFISDSDNENKGIKAYMLAVFDIIRLKDPILYESLQGKGISESLLPMRWILLIFSGEYDINHTIWLWDRIFSDSYRFELLIYCAASAIILMR